MKVALTRHLGPRDIVIGSLNEIIGSGQKIPPGLLPVLKRPKMRAVALGARVLGKSWPEAENIAVKQYYSRRLAPNPPHPPAAAAAAFLGEVWGTYRKFCFTRNPFERVASDYNWRKRMLRRYFTFEEFIGALENPVASGGIVHDHAVTNWDMMSIDGRLVADHVGRYERLEEDFSDMIASLGLPDTPLGREKATAASNRSTYGALYTPALRARVEALFAPELEAFGYGFPY
ncbi:hypothetical protein BA897_00025 [Spiribacter roseus]|nr:hypothetical protein BA897_00025 [Spiribacter roseus]